MDVFITVDTEVWCRGWKNIDERFPELFKRYVYGPTEHGDYGLPMTFKILAEHGLRAVFFVEPLFAARFGIGPLQEIVGLIQEAGHEVQLHMHPEWADEAHPPLLPDLKQKCRLMRELSRTQQSSLIAQGLALLKQAGVEDVNTFRAGSYGANRATLEALQENGISFDSSYNPSVAIGTADIAPGCTITRPVKINGVTEFPVTVFKDPFKGKLRHLQLAACSFAEMAYVLNQAADVGWESAVIVSHNFEFLTPSKLKRDRITADRMRQLCAFLRRHPDRFNVHGFAGLEPQSHLSDTQSVPFKNSYWATGRRLVEQGIRRRREARD